VPILGSRPVLAALRKCVRTLERAVPANAAAIDFLRKEQPDLLLVTPLLYFGSQQVDYVRAARALGIPTVLGVGSWDHLTTKGLIHEQPDRVIVWNEAQRVEAAELHGIQPDEVTVTGAQAYDHWFTQRPTLSRAEFCAKVGVSSDRPLLLYLCSSPFITPYEVGFVRQWIGAIRSSNDVELRRAALLIRPHPQNAQQWHGFDPSCATSCRLWPRAGANPVDREARSDYYDSMYHSVAVVGVNTSALIESGIVGRPCLHRARPTNLRPAGRDAALPASEKRQRRSAHGRLLARGSTAFSFRMPCGARAERILEAARSSKRLCGRTASRQPAADRLVAAVELEATRRPAPRRTRPCWRRTLCCRSSAPMAAAVRVAQRRPPLAASSAEGESAPRRLKSCSSSVLRSTSATSIRPCRCCWTAAIEVSIGVNRLRERKHARLEGLDDARVRILGVIPKRLDVWTPLARAVRGHL
jgi:hypothetical protein